MNSIYAETLSDEARIWIYQADRLLNDQEVACINRKLEKWQEEWNTHGKALYNDAWVEDNLFLIMGVDESHQPASGCSIDSSVHFIRQVGARINVDFFDRMNFAYQDAEGNTLLTTSREMSKLYEKGLIDEETLFYDTTQSTKGAWNQKKLIALKDSWHKRFL